MNFTQNLISFIRFAYQNYLLIIKIMQHYTKYLGEKRYVLLHFIRPLLFLILSEVKYEVLLRNVGFFTLILDNKVTLNLMQCVVLKISLIDVREDWLVIRNCGIYRRCKVLLVHLLLFIF